jgi:hypothetical protein
MPDGISSIMCQLFHDKHTGEYYNYRNVYRDIRSPFARVGHENKASRFAPEAELSSSSNLRVFQSGSCMAAASVRFVPCAAIRGHRSKSGWYIIHFLLDDPEPAHP